MPTLFPLPSSPRSKGTVTYRGQDGNVVEKFEGDWSDGKMHGYGRYVYADSGVYEGQWIDSKSAFC